MRIDLTTQVQNILPVANGGTGTSTGASLPQFADNETPSGLVNGSNAVFTLAHAPNPAGSLLQFVAPSGLHASLYLQGIDYTLAATTVTFGTAPASGSNLRSWYRWNLYPIQQFFREQLFQSDGLSLNLAQFQLPVQLQDSLSMADNFNVYRLPFGYAFSDTLVQSDNFAFVNNLVLLQINEVVSDQLAMSDSISFILSGGSKQVWLADSMLVMNDRITGIGYGLTPSDYLQMVDTIFYGGTSSITSTEKMTQYDVLDFELLGSATLRLELSEYITTWQDAVVL
jgi:hypothetical protein